MVYCASIIKSKKEGLFHFGDDGSLKSKSSHDNVEKSDDEDDDCGGVVEDVGHSVVFLFIDVETSHNKK